MRVIWLTLYNKKDNKEEGSTLKDALKKDPSMYKKKDNKGEGGS